MPVPIHDAMGRVVGARLTDEEFRRAQEGLWRVEEPADPPAPDRADAIKALRAVVRDLTATATLQQALAQRAEGRP